MTASLYTTRSRIVQSLCVFTLLLVADAAPKNSRYRGARRRLQDVLADDLFVDPPDAVAEPNNGETHTPLVPRAPETPTMAPSKYSPKGKGGKGTEGPATALVGSEPAPGLNGWGKKSKTGPPSTSLVGTEPFTGVGPTCSGKGGKGYNVPTNSPRPTSTPYPTAYSSKKVGCTEPPSVTGAQPSVELNPTPPSPSMPSMPFMPSMPSQPSGAQPATDPATQPSMPTDPATQPAMDPATQPAMDPATQPSMPSDPATQPAMDPATQPSGPTPVTKEPTQSPNFQGGQPSGNTPVFVDCAAIAAGTATTQGTETVFVVNMPFYLVPGANFTEVAENVREILQTKVAPKVAGCTDDSLLTTRARRRRRLQDEEPDSTILNVLFATPAEDTTDDTMTCTDNPIANTDCVETDTGVNIYSDGDRTSGYLARLLAELQKAIDDGLLDNVAGLAGVGPVTRIDDVTPPEVPDGAEKEIAAANSGLSNGGKVGVAMGATVLVLLLLLFIRRRRNRQDQAVKAFDHDDENVLLDGTLDGSSTGPAHVLDGDDSFFNESMDSSVIRNIRAIEGMESAERAGNSLLGKHHAGQNVHVCQSSMCEICEKGRYRETVFVKTGTPKRPSLPDNASRPYVASDTVAL